MCDKERNLERQARPRTTVRWPGAALAPGRQCKTHPVTAEFGRKPALHKLVLVACFLVQALAPAAHNSPSTSTATKGSLMPGLSSARSWMAAILAHATRSHACKLHACMHEFAVGVSAHLVSDGQSGPTVWLIPRQQRRPMLASAGRDRAGRHPGVSDGRGSSGHLSREPYRRCADANRAVESQRALSGLPDDTG